MKDYRLSEMKAICQRQYKKYLKTEQCQLCDDCELKQFCNTEMMTDCPMYWEIEEEKEQ